ncbi:MAG: hypothetical protein PHF03_07100, partial [Syntrophomonadaceae bacterium]|nr:hypothetical protein [Syntrophomonadaceae bacterium]
MILASDIKTFLQQKEIASFNIDGYAAIYLSELAAYGEVKWDPLQRVARFDSSQRSGDTILAESSEDANLIAEEIDRREGIIEFHGEKLLYQNQQVGYAHNGKAMVSLDWMAGWLGYQVQSKQNSFMVEGQVGFTNEAVIHILPAKIDQASGIITELPEQTLSLQEQ